jgi:hypothetical protein
VSFYAPPLPAQDGTITLGGEHLSNPRTGVDRHRIADLVDQATRRTYMTQGRTAACAALTRVMLEDAERRLLAAR